MVPNHTQWRVPPKNVEMKLNYSQLPLSNEQTSFGVSTLADGSMYNTSQPPIPVQRHDYPVVDSHPQLNYYCHPDSTATSGSWSNERNSGQEYWQHRH